MLMVRYARPLVRVLALIPAVLLVFAVAQGGAGPNPIEFITHETGAWALRFLLLTLAVTPFIALSGWRWAWPVRRTLGLAAFGYAVLHLSIYVVDVGFSLDAVIADVLKRTYITFGMAALLLMVPLAVTSNVWAKALLKRRWIKLHKLVYLVLILGLVHYFLRIRAGYGEWAVYAGIGAVLLGWRVWDKLRRDRVQRQARAKRQAAVETAS